MPSLKDKKDYKYRYTRGWDNLIEDFLVPTISLANFFDYISGYFSSKLFIPLFIGIKKFILENNGKIRLLVGVPFGEDLNVFNMTREQLEDEFIEVFKDDFLLKNKLDSKLNEHIKLLAWLLYHNKIEIRWGIPIDENGKALSLDNEGGILHEKIGIFRDGSNFVTFSGSSNMTYKGWLRHREEIKIFKSWDETHVYADGDIEKFNLYWENLDPLLKVLNFPIPFKEKIIGENKIESVKEIDFSKIDQIGKEEFQNSLISKLSKKLSEESGWSYREGCIIPKIETDQPWSHQKDAIEYLINNNFNGLLSMATGSGKSKISIFASYNLYNILKKESKKLIIIIGVPDSYLVEQWFQKEVAQYTKNVIRCYSEIPKWKENLRNKIDNIRLLSMDHCFIIGTYKSLNADIINREILDRIQNNVKVLFIGDEVHSLGAPTGQVLMENIIPDYRIGLSATPHRYFDETGTNAILSWFLPNEAQIFEFSLKDAQDLGTIMHYEYHIYECEFSDSHFEEFIKETNKINKRMYGKLDDEESLEQLTILLNKRANLIKKSPNKIPVLSSIITELTENLNNIENFHRTVIYCKDREQRSEVDRILSEINENSNGNITWNYIDGDMPNTDRIIIIEYLTDNKINTIIAMKCLDQGVDIPSLEKAIFVSSSGSDLEHIQRAGRILRRNDLKQDPVHIYDIIVLPSDEQMEVNPDISKKIYEIEKRRIKFFAEYAENNLEIRTILFHLDNKYR